jgi:hypothetical protein
MKLLKVEDGRIEFDNFYFYSDLADYAGSSVVTKDVTNGTVSLISNTSLERKFTYDSCVIDIQKENWGAYDRYEYTECYVGTTKGIYGIKDDIQGENEYWRLLLADGYIQVYCSPDGVTWNNKGGAHIPDPIISQGFRKMGSKSFTLKRYTVYKSAYVTIQNFPEGSIAILKDLTGNEIKRRLFDSSMQVQIILDNNNFQGQLEFTDPNGNLLYETEPMTLQFGDTYVLSPYDIEIIYKGVMVTIPTMLDSLCEMVSIKNISTADIYTNLNIYTTTTTHDLIQLSFDGVTFQDRLTLTQLKPGESIDVIIRVTRSVDSSGFMVRSFQILIE